MGDAVAPEIAATDYHTAGEPFRIVTAGVPPIAGATVAERRETAGAADGLLGEGDVLRHDGIVGSTFLARVVGETSDGVLTEVEGMAYRTGEHRFVLDPRDPLGSGFVLR